MALLCNNILPIPHTRIKGRRQKTEEQRRGAQPTPDKKKEDGPVRPPRPQSGSRSGTPGKRGHSLPRQRDQDDRLRRISSNSTSMASVTVRPGGSCMCTAAARCERASRVRPRGDRACTTGSAHNQSPPRTLQFVQLTCPTTRLEPSCAFIAASSSSTLLPSSSRNLDSRLSGATSCAERHGDEYKAVKHSAGPAESAQTRCGLGQSRAASQQRAPAWPPRPAPPAT